MYWTSRSQSWVLSNPYVECPFPLVKHWQEYLTQKSEDFSPSLCKMTVFFLRIERHTPYPKVGPMPIKQKSLYHNEPRKASTFIITTQNESKLKMSQLGFCLNALHISHFWLAQQLKEILGKKIFASQNAFLLSISIFMTKQTWGQNCS